MVNKKVFISTNKKIGIECKSWAVNNLPNSFQIVDNMYECDVFFSVQYDKILSNKFLTNKRCYNFHPNILPNYGGVGTLSFSILNEEDYSGVTLHKIDSGIDTGDIIDIDKIKLDNDETAYSLHLKINNTMYKMFKRTFTDLLFEKLKAKKQKDIDRKVYKYNQLDKLFDLTTFMRATYFPGKKKPFYNE